MMDNVTGTAEALRLAQPAKEVLFKTDTGNGSLLSRGEDHSRTQSMEIVLKVQALLSQLNGIYVIPY